MSYQPSMVSQEEITISEILAARERIAPYVHRTPVTSSGTLSRRLGAEVFLKLELFQRTGSFKPRGAFNKVLSVGPSNCGEGLVTVSGGNHAQAIAYVASYLGLRSTIVMPANTPVNYVEATRGYGASIVLVGSIAEAFEKVAEYEARGWLMVHPFNDPLVIAGQGTVGLEIVEDCPELTDLFVSIGGGGLMAGVATAVKALRPNVRIWGVETEGADAMAQAIRAGKPVLLPAITSIAKTLGAPSVTERTLNAAQKHLESVTVVPDSEAVDALRVILERIKLLPEPAASCTLAAAERLKGNFSFNSKVVLLLCGGNVGISDLSKFLAVG